MNKLLVVGLTLLIYQFVFAQAPLGKMLSKAYPRIKSADAVPVVIFFRDKGTSPKGTTISDARSLLSERAIRRRLKVRSAGNLLDDADMPLERRYLEETSRHVLAIRHELKWFNAVSALATKSQITELQSLPFVSNIDLLRRWKVNHSLETGSVVQSKTTFNHHVQATGIDYGPSGRQDSLTLIPQVHALGLHGEGIVIGMMDNGWRLLSHEALDSVQIIATYDFVDHKESVVPYDTSPTFGSHGINTLSTIAGDKPGEIVGPAFHSQFILARTENDSSETPIEEDNWARALQWMDSIGVDVTSTSLGYFTFDSGYTSLTWENMDGQTALISRAAAHGAALGIVVVNSAGNDRLRGDPNTLIAPADADSIITAGAVDGAGMVAYFSSYGPTADGRIKPDVMSDGVGIYVADATKETFYDRMQGTSFSCPLTAGAAALVLEMNPGLTPLMVREALRQTSSQTSTPDNNYGWGVVNALAAVYYYYPTDSSWNLLSLPKTVASSNVAALYPGAITHAYYYSNGLYHSTDTVAPGKGYWIKLGTGGFISMPGQLLAADTVILSTGWNLVGGPSFPMPVGNIQQAPDSILITAFFGTRRSDGCLSTYCSHPAPDT